MAAQGTRRLRCRAPASFPGLFGVLLDGAYRRGRIELELETSAGANFWAEQTGVQGGGDSSAALADTLEAEAKQLVLQLHR